MIVSEVHRGFERLAQANARWLRVSRLGEVGAAGGRLPVLYFELHDAKRPARRPPVMFLSSGVHGIEAIGIHLLLAFVEHVVAQAPWNTQVRRLLRRVRICGVPIVNPSGALAGTRCNWRGVDLMRNAPVEAEGPVPLFGGQRLSSRLPYWRGDGSLEPEAGMLCDTVMGAVRGSPFTLALDIHSGFGFRNFLWTPYARRGGRPPTWREYQRIRTLLNGALPFCRYRFEPKSVRYVACGDLWDFMYDTAQAEGLVRRFFPLTLEIGTWRWLRKSPLDALKPFNLYNPSGRGRRRHVFERHIPMMSVLAHMAANHARVF